MELHKRKGGSKQNYRKKLVFLNRIADDNTVQNGIVETNRQFGMELLLRKGGQKQNCRDAMDLKMKRRKRWFGIESQEQKSSLKQNFRDKKQFEVELQRRKGNS